MPSLRAIADKRGNKALYKILMAHQRYQTFLDAITYCALECKACADLYQEKSPALAELCRDCADLCWICAAALLNRGPRFVALITQACADLCDACARACLGYPDRMAQNCAVACEQVVAEYRQTASLIFLEEKTDFSANHFRDDLQPSLVSSAGRSLGSAQ